MATWDDVARICLALPETTEGTSRGWRQWQVRGKAFAEHPIRADCSGRGRDRLDDVGRSAHKGLSSPGRPGVEPPSSWGAGTRGTFLEGRS